VLIMSEESRLGREAIETAYALKQLITAVFETLGGRVLRPQVIDAVIAGVKNAMSRPTSSAPPSADVPNWRSWIRRLAD